MLLRGWILVLLLSAGLGPTTAAGGQSSPSYSLFGPVPISDPLFLSVGYWRSQAGTPELAPRGEVRWELVARVGNTQVQSDVVEENLERFLDPSRREEIGVDFLRQAAERDPRGRIYHLDGELQELELRARFGLGDLWTVGVDLPFVGVGDGFLDETVEEFHSLIDVDQDGRAGLIQDAYRVYFLDGDEELFVSQAPSSGLGNLTLRVKRRLPSMGPFESAAELSIKAPTGDEESFYSSGSWDLAGQWHVAHRGALMDWFGSVGLARVGEWEALDLDASWLFSGQVSVEWHRWSRYAISAQLSATESPFESLDLDRLSVRGTFYLTVAWHYRPRTDWELYLGVTENVVHFENSADLAVVGGWRQSFGRPEGKN